MLMQESSYLFIYLFICSHKSIEILQLISINSLKETFDLQMALQGWNRLKPAYSSL